MDCLWDRTEAHHVCRVVGFTHLMPAASSACSAASMESMSIDRVGLQLDFSSGPVPSTKSFNHRSHVKRTRPTRMVFSTRPLQPYLDHRHTVPCETFLPFFLGIRSLASVIGYRA